MAREIKIRERVLIGDEEYRWVTTVREHDGMGTECFDKNDREIFEGDVLQIRRKLSRLNDKAVVTFSDGAFWVQIRSLWNGKMIDALLYQLIEDPDVSVEVVGRLENFPELRETVNLD